MDLSFLTITFVFIIFLVISYFIGIIRLSSPLILIYLVFCFSYVINQDFEEKVISDVPINNDKDLISKKKYSHEIPKTNDIEKEKIKEISKPVVSFNPKPIVMDSNLMIQKDLVKVKYKEPDLKKDEVITYNEQNNDNSGSLALKEIMICRGVYKRNPIKPGFKFSNNVDSLFCYTKISNSGSKQEIRHIWYYQDKLITSVVYNIKTSYNYRSWSKKNISPSQVGKWRVDIADSRNTILGSREFEISLLNDLY